MKRRAPIPIRRLPIAGIALALVLQALELLAADPVLAVSVSRTTKGKTAGLAEQLSAIRPERGRLMVTTNEADLTAADFSLRVNWRSKAGSNDVVVVSAADSEGVRTVLPDAPGLRVETNAATNGWTVLFPAPRSGQSLARAYRMARRLVLARLAAMRMMPPATNSWPADFRPANLLALYDADGVGYCGSTLLERAVDGATLDARVVPVCPEDVHEGILDRCAGVLFPGGSGRGIAHALHPDGVRRVRDFVARGGGYFGVCAGAYFASSGRSDYAGMLPLKHDQPWGKGRSTVRLGLTDEGEAVLGAEFRRIETSYHNGPVFCDLAPGGSNANVTVLARFESPSTDTNGKTRDEMTGTPAILSATWRRGRIMIVSPHPESRTKFNALVARAIGWTIGQAPETIRACKDTP